MPMRLIDEIEVLQSKLDLVDNPNWHPTSRPSPNAIIETAFWARSVLEVIESVDFRRYGHNLKTNVRTVYNLEDPEHPGSAKAVYGHNKNILLKDLLGVIIHFRYFSFALHADGNHCLDVMSDRHVLWSVYYADFVSAVRSLVLPTWLTAAAVCDLVDREWKKIASRPYHYEAMIFSGVNLFWVLCRAFSFSCLVGQAHHVESFAEMGIVAA